MGPAASGVSPETGLARDWPDGGPPLLWSCSVEPAYGAASVAGGRVYLLDRSETDNTESVRCLSLATGAEHWRHTYDAGGKVSFQGRGQPTVHGAHVYSLGPFGHLYCLDRHSGQTVWTHNLHTLARDISAAGNVRPAPEWVRSHTKYEAAVQPRWGLQRNPVVVGDMLIVSVLSDTIGLVALNRLSGNVTWCSRSIGRGIFTHQTPVVAELHGRRMLIQCANYHDGPPAYMSGIDAATGDVLWDMFIKRYNIPIPSPLVLDDRRIWLAGGYLSGRRIVEIAHRDDTFEARLVSRSTDCTPFIQSPILYKGAVYASSYDKLHNPRGGIANQGLACYAASGERLWSTMPGRHFEQGGLLIADDLIFIVHGIEGTLHLVKAQTNAFVELDVAPVFPPVEQAKPTQANIWSPPALSEGRLLLRDATTLKCLDVRGRD
jgi:outer membrane protein assembly factor BamB